jgi:glycosyltransferase involved in cell wall biosynthesis
LGWHCTGIELARTEADYQWRVDLDHLSFKNLSIVQDRALEAIPFPKLSFWLWRTLDELQPDVMAIAGYSRLAMLAALLWCRQHRKPAILLSETTEQDFTRAPSREGMKRVIVHQFSAALVGGKPHTRYLQKLGMAAEAIFPGYDVVGNERFHPEQIRSLPSPHPRPYILSINRFLPKKNLPFLITAYAQYHREVRSITWDLVICGDGLLRDNLEQQIRQLDLQEHIHLPGFLQQDELLPYFAHARCLIHASLQEQWGLVVNEAMAAGLPVLVSNRCGCFEDLVQDGITGFGFDPTDASQLTELMGKLSTGAIDAQQMGENALAHIQNYSPDRFAENLVAAANYALHPRSK